MEVKSDLKKNCLKRLWKDIFGDTEEYIDLIFDNIYNEKISPAELYEDSESLITEASSGLVGVDYGLSEKDETFSGAYICGVATRPYFRRNGRMGRMINTLLQTLPSSGYKFAFLIPAGDNLRRYYSRFGFSDMSPRHYVELRSSEDICEFKQLYSALNRQVQNSVPESGEMFAIDEFSGEIGLDILDYISDIWNKYELNYYGKIIRHNKIQRHIATCELLASGGKILFCRPDNTLAFMEITTKEGETHSESDRLIELSKDCNREIKVTVLGKDESSLIRIINRVTDTIKASVYRFIIAPNIPIRHLQSFLHYEKYGMIRFFDSDENLKFTTDRPDDSKYPILANNNSSDIFMFLMMD